jgi:hypothetical protein
VITYPKIETLYERDPDTFKVNPDRLRCPEFALIRRWRLTEKIDGTNIRVGLAPDGRVTFGGRTDKAQIPPHLLAYLTETFPAERVAAAFAPGVEVVLFGEGYGEKVQSGGDYRTGVSFRLFDVRVGDWWLNAADVDDVAAKLGIQTAPCFQRDIMFLLYPSSADELRDLLPGSIVAGEEGRGRRAEGIIARTDPLLFMRDGRRVMWKLKFTDF